MSKVVILQPINKAGAGLLKNAELDVVELEGMHSWEWEKECSDADGILVRNGTLSGSFIRNCRSLKVIARHGVGLENIDLETANDLGITVTNTPMANSVSVAEHVLTLMLALAKNLRKTEQELRQGNFDIRHKVYGIELKDKTLGILGLGKVGSRLARKAAFGFDMKVIGYDPYIEASTLPEHIHMVQRKEEVCKMSDVVSIHMPLNKQTKNTIGKKEFSVMKPSAFFINCARAEIVDENALVEALEKGNIAGAGIDVYASDPPPKDLALLSMENTVVTPHYAAHTHEAMNNMAVHAAQGIIDVLNGNTPQWPVN